VSGELRSVRTLPATTSGSSGRSRPEGCTLKFDESRLDIFRIVAQGGIFCHFELGEKAIEKPLVLKDHWTGLLVGHSDLLNPSVKAALVDWLL
jgi:hypothetical protein